MIGDLFVVLAAAVAAAVYVVFLWVHAYGRCRWCKGSGRVEGRGGHWGRVLPAALSEG